MTHSTIKKKLISSQLSKGTFQMGFTAVANMNLFGRVAACGVISEYTGNKKRAAPDMIDIVYKRIKIQGFLAADLMKVYSNFFSETVEYLRAGKIQAIEYISNGLESMPSAFLGLFLGSNVGKKIIQVADE